MKHTTIYNHIPTIAKTHARSTHTRINMRQSTMLLTIIALVTVFNVANAAGDCYLRQNTSTAIDPAMTIADQKNSKAATKPFPSLTQCYKYNTEACCVSGHDQQIQSHFSNLLSSTCLREFPDLEVYMCFGCHPQQPKYVDLAAKKNTSM